MPIGIAPGQFAAFYDGTTCLGAGVVLDIGGSVGSIGGDGSDVLKSSARSLLSILRDDGDEDQSLINYEGTQQQQQQQSQVVNLITYLIDMEE